jgi:hypothetical protein
VAPTGCQGCHLSGFPYIEAITRDVECNSWTELRCYVREVGPVS